MAHNLRFRGEWQDKNGGLSRFDIMERDYAGNAEVMEMQEDPLDITRATLDDKFTPGIGSGLTLSVTATYDGQFSGLYTKDKQKFKGLFYKNDVLVWMGYLNSEVYSEQFDRNEYYPVSLEFNDGFTVLERMEFVDENGDHYSGLKTAWEVIWIILDKLDIDFKYLYVACNVYEENMDTLSSPFHQKQVNCANYYDESDDAMNCREVLEAIVKLQRAVCFTNEACLNIISTPLLNGEFERRRYTSEDSEEVLQTVNPTLTIPTHADWYASDQSIDVISAYNKATLAYSPYGVEDVIENYDWSDTDLWNGDWSWEDIGSYYELQNVSSVDGWTMLNGATFSGSKEESTDDDEIYVLMPFETDTTSEVVLLENEVSDTKVTGVSDQGFKVSYSIYIETKEDEFDDDEEAQMVYDFSGYFVISVAGKRPEDIGDDPWVWSENSWLQKIGINPTGSTIADSWQTVEVIIPGNCPFGSVKIQILKRFSATKEARVAIDDDVIKNIRIKDIEITLVNLTRYTAQSGRIGVTQSDADYDDIEFVATMDDEWLNEADDIEFLHGDSKENNATDKGGLHLLDDSFTSAWKTPNDTEYYDIAKIFLRSYVSNYSDSLKQLSGTLEAANFFNGSGLNIDGILSFHSVLTYPSTSLGDKKLMFMGGTYNDKKQTLNGTWLEVLSDDLTINEG